MTARWLAAAAAVDLAALLPRRRRAVPLYAGFDAGRPVVVQRFVVCAAHGARYTSTIEPTCECSDRQDGAL